MDVQVGGSGNANHVIFVELHGSEVFIAEAQTDTTGRGANHANLTTGVVIARGTTITVSIQPTPAVFHVVLHGYFEQSNYSE